ncbi:uncharacterized protein FRV6_11580 [Fusarium oxysporum]|uniref:Uncharacterized protein n=3 Tax=Fusarium oxysporum TaxID=5507 RepID=A0A2H3TFH1_FUSOX|nr:hypothetical protein FOVG_14678 [Fusarium oxysporum f. sp. pisi HDV247]TVY61970.1 hypothetical protein Focb16_v014132 [Fusarium oxysporum f. sp. cubense]SCO87453.1 uncharacterized protein FRV6_11580 [Fusarium oxysporum]
MKFTTILSITSLLGLSQSAAIHMSRNPSTSLSTRQDPAWSFSVYQSSERCTGARDTYSGDGTQECTQGIRNGSFGSYTTGEISDKCSVYIYNNDNCDDGGIIDILTSADPEGCLQPQLEVTGVASFRAQCG